MHIGVIGINHHSTTISFRKKLIETCHLLTKKKEYVFHSLVLLSTCNRIEIYFSSNDLHNTFSFLLHYLQTHVNKDILSHLYHYRDKECFYHLCKVTTGLNSAILGETEIQGQIKDAYTTASTQISLPSVMHFIFQKALRIGKKTRFQFSSLLKGLPKLEDIIEKKIQKQFSKPPSICFIGASEINLKLIDFFQKQEIPQLSLCNRSTDRLSFICKKKGLRAIPWHQQHLCYEHSLVIFGTKAPYYLLTHKQLPQQHQVECIIDLSVPRNVDPQLSHHSTITIWSMDTLHQEQQSTHLFFSQKIQMIEKFILQNVEQHYCNFMNEEKYHSLPCALC